MGTRKDEKSTKKKGAKKGEAVSHMGPKPKDPREVRDIMILIRSNQEEADLLDAAVAAGGYEDRAKFIRETMMARLRGGRIVPPADAPDNLKVLAQTLGGWKAMGTELYHRGMKAPEVVEAPPAE